VAEDVYLGVLVGKRKASSRPYHEQTTFFRRLITEGKNIGVKVYIFSPSGISWKKRRIRGWTWTGRRWVSAVYPFPHAVYDRVSPRMIADFRAVVRARARFARRRIPRFNTRIGSKWRLHKVFMKDPVLAPALPHTRLLTRASLDAMLRRYGEVYIKPASGGQGKGVSWARKVPGGYLYCKSAGGRTRRGRVTTVAALAARCAYRGRAMLVQQAIPVLTYRRRVFDVRALVQRREDGEWALTGMVARLGAPSRKVTNIHAGGKALPLETVLEESGAGPDVIEGVRARVEELALAAANAVARSSQHVGELGVDVAVDKEYRCWLIEVNSRTGRISFHRAGMKEEARKADQGPAAYARFLAGRGRHGVQGGA